MRNRECAEKALCVNSFTHFSAVKKMSGPFTIHGSRFTFSKLIRIRHEIDSLIRVTTEIKECIILPARSRAPLIFER